MSAESIFEKRSLPEILELYLKNLGQQIGEKNFFTNANAAIDNIYARLEQQGIQPKYRLLNQT
jgi:hypothetical protein